MSFTKLTEILTKVGEIEQQIPEYLYGIVTGDDPLTVTLDGERGDVVSPSRMVEVHVGDRVILVRRGSFVSIMGHAGGEHVSETVWAVGQGVENLGNYAYEVGQVAQSAQDHFDELQPVVEGITGWMDETVGPFIEDTNTELGKLDGAAAQARDAALAAMETAQNVNQVAHRDAMPDDPFEGMTVGLLNDNGSIDGVAIYRNGEWADHETVTGLVLVPGVDGVPTVIDGTGLYSPQATLEVLRSELFYADVAGVRTLVITGIPRENMAADVGAALAEAERVGGVITMTTRKGLVERDEDPNEDIPQLVLAREREVGAPLSGVIIEPNTLDFVVDGESTVSLDGPRSLMTAENVYVRDTIQIGEHQVRTLPGTNITVFQHVGGGI